ncbi:alpha/beta hydrolase [PVC group bacterium]|nr:alpha/beta hydrolase [PVC group bacterium]
MNNYKTNPSPGVTEYIATGKERWDGAVVIFPGGGYAGLAEHEGKEYAEFLLEYGISSFVVEYRLGSNGHRHPEMIEDAFKGIQIARNRCAKLDLNPAKTGVMGSSAGGHLAALTITTWKEYGAELRPAFAVLCYPVIDLTGPYANRGSRDNLLGTQASDDVAVSLSPHNLVDKTTCPVFLWHTGEDKGVPMENSIMMAEALRNNDIPFEMHIYHEGTHGIGLNTEHPWGRDVARWIKRVV